MAVKATEVLKALGILGGLGTGAFTPGALSLLGKNGAMIPGISAGRSDTSKGASMADVAMIADQFVSQNYPREFYPDRLGHTVNTVQVGPDVHNSHLNAGVAKDAARMQTLDEHNQTLLQFIRPKMTPSQMHEAIQMGVEAEKALDSYWADSEPRKKYTPSSSAVAGVRITPDARIEVSWYNKKTGGPGKWYTFRQFPNTYDASIEAQKLLMSSSLGRSVMPAKIAAKSTKGGDLGWWNKANYDGSFAK